MYNMLPPETVLYGNAGVINSVKIVKIWYGTFLTFM